VIWRSSEQAVRRRGNRYCVPLFPRCGDIGILASGDERLYEEVRRHERTGRPLGNGDFIKSVLQILNRELEIKRLVARRRINRVCVPVFPRKYARRRRSI